MSISDVDLLPRFLTGTIGKELAYVARGFQEFCWRLDRHATLVCSGYGWPDSGIDARVNDWWTRAACGVRSPLSSVVTCGH